MRLDHTTHNEYAFYISNCPFSEEEEEIFSARRRGKSVVSIAMQMNISESTVKRRIASIKRKMARELLE